MYTFKQLKKVVKKAKKKDGLFEQNFIILMECKLPSFIYRSSFLPNMFESIHYIKNSNVAVNKKF
jgi:ribosomal protein S4